MDVNVGGPNDDGMIGGDLSFPFDFLAVYNEHAWDVAWGESQLPVPSMSNSAPLNSLSRPSIPMSELQRLFDLPGPDPLPPQSSASPPLGGPNRSLIPMSELLCCLHNPVNSDSGVLNICQGP